MGYVNKDIPHWKEGKMSQKKELTEEYLAERFPELWAYVSPKETTDVDFNCGNLWLTTTKNKTTMVYDEKITEEYMRNVAATIALVTCKEFNQFQNILCCDTDTLRVTCVHQDTSSGNISVCLRKEIPELRYTMQEAIDEGFCDEQTFRLLVNCVDAGCFNFTFCGTPGTGKTELLKNLSSFISKHKKVITIEDVSEIHYQKINPDHNCIELKVGKMTYQDLINFSLRMNAEVILFGESIGKNAKYLLECWANGVTTMSTLHVQDARSIPDKIVNALGIRQDNERIINQLHNDVGIAILVKKKEKDGVLKRYIDQICFYYRKDGVNGQAMVVEDGVLYPKYLPAHIKKKIEDEIERDAFS